VTLTEYFAGVQRRLPSEAARVLMALNNEGAMNKEELSLTSNVKRAVLDHVVMQLYALGLIEVATEGKSKICSITSMGYDYMNINTINAG
jgi:predicted transcriptional regulator